jgi:tetratricopeptide (TPR) repeat protein
MSQSSLSPTLREALAIHRQGFPTRAIPIYERALKENPDDPDALSSYGLALIHSGRPSEAETPLKRAVSLQPEGPAYKTNLAELYFKVGDQPTAVSLLQEVTRAHPNFAPAWARVGRAHVERQDLAAAADALDKALQLDPQDHATAVLLARALAAMQNYGAAYHVLDHAEKIRPDDVGALKLRLEIARVRRDFPALEALSRRLTEISPADASGWRDLATALFDTGRFSDSLAAIERAQSLTPPTAESLSQLATIAINALEFDKAEAALREAEKLSPDEPRLLSTMALLRTYQGRKQEAEEYCVRCLRADPSFAGVYPQLSVLRNGRLNEEEEGYVRAYSRREDVIPGSRASASFVLAHSLDARGEIDAAFEEYQRANREAAERNRRDEIRYDFEGHKAWTDAIISVFASGEDAAESYHDGPQPIFIVGLPRCGSTLVESVIAAHSEVEPGGEMPMMPNIFNNWFRENYSRGPASISAPTRQAIAAAYMRNAPMRLAKPRFTDKNLLNLEAAGFIAQVFPKAVIINIRRNPVENAFSIWRQDMLKFWAFATSFEDIARRYGLYARLVDHFERTMPQRFHTIQYEEFVSSFDEQARQLIDRCGLAWEDACLKFQEARAIAPTISAMQVRSEVSLPGDRSRLYGARLDPLRRALDEAGVDLTTGALKKG